ncbi:DUF6152 family protein [Histidinibacterium lentulum]|uniref:DNA-binding protein n=1 Tax=Histidinibacterium lentulum TaxID=2480588 RepID=A0A3N2R9J7_9RHOB|nr:DUF6152 family protein [Histidinibacterium lentulum]ROU04144.1 hypothetical protein EAT49_01725 [Histidinibacterium lentulum]
MIRFALATILALATALPALAHHGWRWTEGGQFELTGRVTEAQLGNPHGVLTMQVDDETWTVEVGQPWRNDRAGLTDEMLAPGAELVIIGERSADPADQRMKAEAVVIDGETYPLYPERL